MLLCESCDQIAGGKLWIARDTTMLRHRFPFSQVMMMIQKYKPVRILLSKIGESHGIYTAPW